jgi:hypothetical protein
LLGGSTDDGGCRATIGNVVKEQKLIKFGESGLHGHREQQRWRDGRRGLQEGEEGVIDRGMLPMRISMASTDSTPLLLHRAGSLWCTHHSPSCTSPHPSHTRPLLCIRLLRCLTCFRSGNARLWHSK